MNVEVNLLNLVAVVLSAFAFGYTLGNKDFVYRLTDKILNKSDDSDDLLPPLKGSVTHRKDKHHERIDHF